MVFFDGRNEYALRNTLLTQLLMCCIDRLNPRLFTCHSAADTTNVAFGKLKATSAVRAYALDTSSAMGALVPAGAKSSSST